MLPRLFARRYLFSPQSRSVVNLISGLSVASVAMPVAAMIILLSVFNGFERLIHAMYATFDAPLTVTPREGQTFGTDRIDTAALHRIAGVEALSFTLEQSALFVHGDRQATATLRGVDDNYEALFTLDPQAVIGTWSVRQGDLERLVVGQEMAHQLGIRSLVGADVTAYAVRRGNYSMLLPMANYTRRTVPTGGVYALDLETERQYVLGSLRLVQELFNYPGRASALLLRLDAACDPQRAKEAVEAIVGEEFRVRTRDELRASFYRIVAYEKWGIFFIALLVLVIASFSVIGALSMLIVEKRDDITTLRALGAPTTLLRAIFRREGLMICTLGAAIGTVIGVGATLLQQYFGVIEIPADSFLTKSYPVVFRPADLLLILAAFALVATALSHLTVRNTIKNETRHE